MNIVNGDILNAKEDIICHQVNCKGVMGSGLAKQIRIKYPEVFQAYKGLYDMQPSKKTLLGHAMIVPCTDGKIVANLFGQNNYGTNKCQTDYNALGESFNRLFSAVVYIEKYKGMSIAIPFGIGCGLAGGDWSTVSGIIEKIAKTYGVENYTIYKFEQ